VGFDFRVEGIREFESFGPNSDFYGILHLSLEPRWYYNLDRRLKKEKTSIVIAGTLLLYLPL
jgi:hypothetical protein